MNEVKWTPEPWGCVGTETATHQIVSRTLDPESDPVVLMEITDYDRSVACVNALVGIADPEAFVKRAKAIEEAARFLANWAHPSSDLPERKIVKDEDVKATLVALALPGGAS